MKHYKEVTVDDLLWPSNHLSYIFGPYLLQPNGWMIKMPLGMDVGLSPGDFVLDGDPALSSPKMGAELPSPFFGPFLLWSNGCMDQDATWYGGRPQPRGLCVIWEPSPLNFRLMFIIVIVISLEHCTKRSRYWFIQVQVQVLYSMHSIFRIV